MVADVPFEGPGRYAVRHDSNRVDGDYCSMSAVHKHIDDCCRCLHDYDSESHSKYVSPRTINKYAIRRLGCHTHDSFHHVDAQIIRTWDADGYGARREADCNRGRPICGPQNVTRG